MNIKLTKAQRIKINGSKDTYKIMKQILLRENKVDQGREHFWGIGLNNSNKILNIELISLGSINNSIVEPMEVFSVVLQKRTVRMIFIHNHPSGELVPSEDDKDVTNRLIQVGKIVNIDMVDHLIISTKTYMSFADTGLLEELSLSTKWVPNYILEQKIRKEEKKIRERAIKKAVKDTEKTKQLQ